MGKIIKRVLLTILAVIVVILVVFIAGAWSIFGEKIMAANSVKKLDDNLYFMEYKGDYGVNDLMKQGGASSSNKMGEYITDFLSGGFMKKAPQMAAMKFGCTAFTVKDTDGNSLMGRNYDWDGDDGKAMIVHTKPDEGYESYSTCWLDFLGFGANWKPEGMSNQYMSLAAIYVPLDGINEKGLCVADLMVGDDEQTNQKSDKADVTTTLAIRLLLDKAANVEEAIALLETYDMNSDIGRGHHLAISDANGRSVVIEYINNEMFVTDTSIVTNHYLTEGEKFGIGNPESHARFEKVAKVNEENDGVMDANTLRDTMESVSYAKETQWSIVYHMEEKALDFYWKRQYENPYHFEMK